MSRVSVEAATADRFVDVQHALTGGGDGASCQCQWWTLTNAQFSAATAEERRRMLRDEIDAGPPPGLIAYVEDVAAGWVRILVPDRRLPGGRTVPPGPRRRRVPSPRVTRPDRRTELFDIMDG